MIDAWHSTRKLSEIANEFGTSESAMYQEFVRLRDEGKIPDRYRRHVRNISDPLPTASDEERQEQHKPQPMTLDELYKQTSDRFIAMLHAEHPEGPRYDLYQPKKQTG